ncbi:MAG: hypothetical protein LUC37_02160 [Prevotella sp.]|nr:hypothetical protein [Prevotella sp.]
MIKIKENFLDYSIADRAERESLVNSILSASPPEKLTAQYLEYLTDYILGVRERKHKNNDYSDLLTTNRLVTINKRESSYQQLEETFFQKDYISTLITNDKNVIFSPKVTITAADLKEIPGLQELQNAIAEVSKQQKKAKGKLRYLLKQQEIQMRQQQYILKNSYRPSICFYSRSSSSFPKLNLEDSIYIEDGKPRSRDLITLLNPAHVSLLLHNYSRIKEDTYSDFKSDMYYLIWDLENLIDKTLSPLLFRLLVLKIDGACADAIRADLYSLFHKTYCNEYISVLWRKKIPRLISEQYARDVLVWYYTTQERGLWKKCSRCGQIKLAHPYFFSRNKTSKDGFYSICKVCRHGGGERGN